MLCILIILGQIFFISWFTGIFFSDLGSGGREKKRALKMTSQLVIFRAVFFFNISRTNSKTSKVNQQYVLNL